MDAGQQSLFDLFPGTAPLAKSIVTVISRLPPKAAEASEHIRQWVTEASPNLPASLQPGLCISDDCGRDGVIKEMMVRPIDGHACVAVLIERDDSHRGYDLIQGVRLHPVHGLMTPAGRFLIADIPELMPVPGDHIGRPTWNSEETPSESLELIQIGTTVHIGDRWDGTTPATVVGYRGIWLCVEEGDGELYVRSIGEVNQFPYVDTETKTTAGMTENDLRACNTAHAMAQEYRTQYTASFCESVDQAIASAALPLDEQTWRTLFSYHHSVRWMAIEDPTAKPTLNRLIEFLTKTLALPRGIVISVGPSDNEGRDYLQVTMTIPDLHLTQVRTKWISADHAIKNGYRSQDSESYLADLAERCETDFRSSLAKGKKEAQKKAAEEKKLLNVKCAAFIKHLTTYGGDTPCSLTVEILETLCRVTGTKTPAEDINAALDVARKQLSNLVLPIVQHLTKKVMAHVYAFEMPSSEDIAQIDFLRDFLDSDQHPDLYSTTNIAELYVNAFGVGGRIKELAPGEWAYLEPGSCGWDTHGAVSETGYRSVSSFSQDDHADMNATLAKLHREVIAYKLPKKSSKKDRYDHLLRGITAETAAVILNRHSALPLEQRANAITRDVESILIAEQIRLMNDGLALVTHESAERAA